MSLWVKRQVPAIGRVGAWDRMRGRRTAAAITSTRVQLEHRNSWTSRDPHRLWIAVKHVWRLWYFTLLTCSVAGCGSRELLKHKINFSMRRRRLPKHLKAGLSCQPKIYFLPRQEAFSTCFLLTTVPSEGQGGTRHLALGHISEDSQPRASLMDDSIPPIMNRAYDSSWQVILLCCIL